VTVLQEGKRYTYAEYYSWDDDTRWELMEGAPYAMVPAPGQKHQSIVGELYAQLATFLKKKPCKVFVSPFDVRLNADSNDDTVVQPDVIVVCDMTKLDGKSCVGAPDMVIEVLSPSTARRDRFMKLRLYQLAGIREYWIVDPDLKAVSVHVLEDGKYFIAVYDETDVAPVNALKGCVIDLSEVFME